MTYRPLLAALLAIGLAGPALGQATVKADGKFRSAVGLGASFSSGNSKTSNLSLAADGVRATDREKTTLYATAQYARSAGVTTSERIRLGGREDVNLTPLIFAFGGLDLERDKAANLKSRGQLSGGLGYHLIKGETTVWDLFGGVGYTQDSYISPMLIDGSVRTSYGYVNLLLGEESTHKLSATTSAKQRLMVMPSLKNNGEFRATWDAGLSVAMSSALSLNVGFNVSHNSEPGPGRKSTDTLLTTGVSMKFD